jgi:hypothetical protein
MLNSDQLRECLEVAERCRRKAAAHPEGSQLREDFFDLEQRWLALARSIEFNETLPPIRLQARIA